MIEQLESAKIRKTIVDWAKHDPKIQKITDDILDNFVANTKNLWFCEEDYLSAGESVPTENDNLSVMDLYYTKEIKDDDLSFLSWFLGWCDYVRINVNQEPYITHKWFERLNHILNMASKHARRNWLSTWYFRNSFGEKGMDIMDYVWAPIEKEIDGKMVTIPSPKKWKIYFRVKTKEQYLQLIKKLTSPDSAPFFDKERDWVFLKNIVDLWYLWRNEVYSQKRKLFQYVITDIFWKFFHHEFSDFSVNTDTHGDHGHTITESFDCVVGGEKVEVTLTWNVKSEKSTVDKLMREKTATATNDIIRFQLKFKNHRQMVNGLNDFVNFYLNNNWRVFDHEPWDFWNLKWVDKNALNSINTNNLEHINDLQDWKAKDFIKHIEYNRKKWSSNYRDMKLIVPVNVKWTVFNIEVKFVTQDYDMENDRWYSSHVILKWLEKIATLSRHKKYVTTRDVENIVQEIIKDWPELEDQIWEWNKKILADELYSYLLDKCEKINIPGHETVYLLKWVKETLNNEGFWPHIQPTNND